jgi:hypothetical protein
MHAFENYYRSVAHGETLVENWSIENKIIVRSVRFAERQNPGEAE